MQSDISVNLSQTPDGIQAVLATPDMTADAAPVWSVSPRDEKATGTNSSQANAGDTPPAVWARYIDSRLKQFCTR